MSISDLMQNLNITDEGNDLEFDIHILVQCFNQNKPINKRMFIVPPHNRDYKKIILILKTKYSNITTYDFLEFMPLIDEYLQSS